MSAKLDWARDDDGRIKTECSKLKFWKAWVKSKKSDIDVYESKITFSIDHSELGDFELTVEQVQDMAKELSKYLKTHVYFEQFGFTPTHVALQFGV